MAKFKVAAIFSSNMVLQRDKNIKIFGQGKNGEEVTLQFLGQTYSTNIQGESWTITLPPMPAGDGYEMIISCANEQKRFDNIAIGEVWLAGGQSNMEYELQNCEGGLDMLQSDKGVKVRFYYTPKMATMDEEFYRAEEASYWNEFDSESARAWSAVGYIFAKKLSEELGVTVGIIGCNWGGTSASCWISKKALREDAELISYLDEYEKAIEGKSVEEQILEYKEYLEYQNRFDKMSSELYKKDPDISWNKVQEICGENRYPGPINCVNPMRPSGLYECMLRRIMPYTLKGFIYYQGESDDHKPLMYQKLLTRLIRQWREDWEDQTLPFLNVQLPMHRYKADPDWKHWCLIREAQMNTYQTIKNTGIAVILDCGEFNEIHPKDKKPVGERLALQALYHVYKQISASQAFGPIYRSFIYRNGAIELHFDYADDGFMVKGEPEGFEVAGYDKIYHKAEVKIDQDTILLSSPEVTEPRYARYCWTNYGEVSIYGKNGLPLAPFRISNNDSE